jgi:hypothetical protein
MLAIIIGVILIIVAVFMWVGHITPEHAIAILTGASSSFSVASCRGRISAAGRKPPEVSRDRAAVLH